MATSAHNPSANNHSSRPKIPFLSTAPSSSDPAPKLSLSNLAAKLITGVHPAPPDVARDRWASSSPSGSEPRPTSQTRPKVSPIADPARSVTASVFAAARQERAAYREQDRAAYRAPLAAPHRHYPPTRHPNEQYATPRRPRPLSTGPPASPRPHHQRSHTQVVLGMGPAQGMACSPARSAKSSAPAVLDGIEVEDGVDSELSVLIAGALSGQTKENHPPGQARKKTGASGRLGRSQPASTDFVAVAYNTTSRADGGPCELANASGSPGGRRERRPTTGRTRGEPEPNPMRELYLAQVGDCHGRVENEKQRVAREFEKLLDAMQITEAVRLKMNGLDHPVKSAMLKSSTSASLATMIGKEMQCQVVEDSKPESKEGSAWWAMYLKSHNFRELVTGDLRRLRVALRTQPPLWTSEFVGYGGYTALLRRLKELLEIEWREEQHDDQVLFEILRCFKALLLTDPGRKALGSRFPDPFIQLTSLLFSEKKPGDLSSRQVLLELIYGCFEIDAWRPAKLDWGQPIALDGRGGESRPQTESTGASAHTFVKSLLGGPPDQKKEQMVEFVIVTHRARPFKTLVNEFVGVLMDYFWVFCHAENQFWDLKLVDEEKLEGPKVPSGMTGGVEYEAMSYCTAMMKLINRVIKSCEGNEESNRIHGELFESGFERCLVTLRKSSTTYYPMVHLEIARYLDLGLKTGFEFPYSILRHLVGYQAFK